MQLFPLAVKTVSKDGDRDRWTQFRSGSMGSLHHWKKRIPEYSGVGTGGKGVPLNLSFTGTMSRKGYGLSSCEVRMVWILLENATCMLEVPLEGRGISKSHIPLIFGVIISSPLIPAAKINDFLLDIPFYLIRMYHTPLFFSPYSCTPLIFFFFFLTRISRIPLNRASCFFFIFSRLVLTMFLYMLTCYRPRKRTVFTVLLGRDYLTFSCFGECRINILESQSM